MLRQQIRGFFAQCKDDFRQRIRGHAFCSRDASAAAHALAKIAVGPELRTALIDKGLELARRHTLERGRDETAWQVCDRTSTGDSLMDTVLGNLEAKGPTGTALSDAYRKRLVGGFYAYENNQETKLVGSLCSGITDARGRLHSLLGPALCFRDGVHRHRTRALGC